MMDPEISCKMYKSIELKCLNGDYFIFGRLRDHISSFLRQSGKDTIYGEFDELNESDLPIISINGAAMKKSKN